MLSTLHTCARSKSLPFLSTLQFSRKTQRKCLLPLCSPPLLHSVLLANRGQLCQPLFFFQAIAKLNLPHKLIGQQLQSEGDGLKEKTKESNRKREGQRQTTRKATEQTKNSATPFSKIIFKLCFSFCFVFLLNNMLGGLDWHFS